MNRLYILIIIPILVIGIFLFSLPKQTENQSSAPSPTPTPEIANPLYIESLINRSYSGSVIKIEETLTPTVNYQRHIASYLSDGLKIYGLLTIPHATKPDNGFPSIVFLHGYLDPKTYQTTERYVAYQDGFARNGFITFKPDLRGHGQSEGQPVNSHISHDYVIDTLNLVSALKIYPSANPQLIGLWGHSNGGSITLRSLVVSPDIKTAVVWAGVVGSYQDMLVTYRHKIPWLNNRSLSTPDLLIQKYGPPDLSTPFWSKFDPYSYISNINTPLQIHHGTADSSVPVELSQHLNQVLTDAQKKVEYYEYPGADRNISGPSFSTAIQRSIDFFKKYLQ